MKKVLVVDDEKSLLEIFKILLTSMNHEVDVASSSKEALDLFSNNYDKVFIDYFMYEEESTELIEKSIEKYGVNNVCVVTGVNDVKTLKRINNLGVQKILKKPILATEFGKIIND